MPPHWRRRAAAVTDRIVAADSAVTLVGGGPVSVADLHEALRLAPQLVAADGGAAACLAAGAVPEAVIGDMDSLDLAARARLPAAALHPIPEQDSTDFEKCLTRIEAPLIIALGFGGGLLDHTLAVLNAMARHPARRCVLMNPRDAVCLVPPRLEVDLPAGTRVSLFPMAPAAGTSEGLHWPIDGIDFAPDGRSGTSNRATGPVELTTRAPGLLLILPRNAGDALLCALATAPGWGT